jgi:hypothetical protein
MTEIYDDLTWEVDELPIGSSTPDELFENSFRASTTCENGHTIEGVAYYWSHFENMSDAWLSHIEYDDCEECEDESEDDDDF